MKLQALEAEIGIVERATEELVRFAKVIDGLLDVVLNDATRWVFRRLFPTAARQLIEIHELLEAFIRKHERQ